MKIVLILVTLMSSLFLKAQIFYDSFSDGDYTNNPPWSGNKPCWNIADATAGPDAAGSNTLHLATNIAGTDFLSVPNTIWATASKDQTWGFWMGRTANANNTNISVVWLFADRNDLNDKNINGYRIAFGEAGDDAIVLEKVVNGISEAILISREEVQSGLLDYGFRVRVTRSVLGVWELFTALNIETMLTGGGEPASSSAVGVDWSQGSALEAGSPVIIGGTGYFGFQTMNNGTLPQLTGAQFDAFYYQFEGLLPVTFTSFYAIKDNDKARLNWQVTAEDKVDGYEVERSANGVQFSKLGSVKANGGPGYDFTDEKILPGPNFYRIKNVDIDGKFAYTHIVSINGKKGQFIKLFPIPSRTDLYIHHHEAIKGAQLKITSIDGRIVRVIRVPPNASQTIFKLSTIQPGVYFATYDSGDGNKLTSSFIKQ
jgi:hypothetical protein